MNSLVQQFQNHKYLNLETFRRSGVGVRTPVWFVQEGTTLYVRTSADSGKVRRVRNNGRARLVPSDATGVPVGAWVEGTARLVVGEEAHHANQLARRKYGALKLAFDLLSCLQRRTWATIRIDLPQDPMP